MLKTGSLVMKVQISHLFSGLSFAALLALAPFAAAAQDAPMMGGGTKGEEMMGSGGMMGGDMTRMPQMMTMMREKLAHTGDRIASLKTELKITEAQTPAWNKFADAVLESAKSMGEAMEAMHSKMMQSGTAMSLPEKLEHHVTMAAAHLANLQAIKGALDPLYASFSDEQKRHADEKNIGPMGLM
jgi:hypothetical protein